MENLFNNFNSKKNIVLIIFSIPWSKKNLSNTQNSDKFSKKKNVSQLMATHRPIELGYQIVFFSFQILNVTNSAHLIQN